MKNYYDFIKNNQEKFLLLVAIYLLISIFASLPFFNIAASPTLTLFILFVSTAIIFKIPSKVYVLFAFIFVLASLIFQFLKQGDIFEVTSVLAYSFIFLSVLIEFYSYLKTIKKDD